MKKPSELEPRLGAALRAESSEPCTEPIDPVALAEYIDGVLREEERDSLERHLVACRSCRELAMEAGLAVAEGLPVAPFEPHRAKISAFRRGSSRRWPPREWLAAAAVLIAAVGIFVWLRPQTDSGATDRRAALGVPEAAWEQLDTAARATVERALVGNLEPLPIFADLLESGAAQLRAADGAEAPLPLSPRWSVIRDPRPTLRFAVPPPQHPIGEAQACELLVVDRRETPVLAVPCRVEDRKAQIVEQGWPTDQPALEPGGVYAWKVSLKLDGEWSVSEYVPFQVLPGGSAVPVPQGDLAAGAELLAAGLHEEALARWSHLDFGSEDARVRRRLLRSILERQRLPEAWIEREIAQRTGAGLP